MSRLIYFSIIGLCILSSIVITQFSYAYDGKLHIIFCDVGQGDAIFIRTPARHEILIDGGPDTKVLQCLDRHLPFWDRSITTVLLTHPHYDHFRGLIDVFERYTISLVGLEDLKHESSAYEVFTDTVSKEETRVQIMNRGTTLTFADGVILHIVGPDPEFLHQENPDGYTGGGNPPSLIIHIQYGSFDFLHTGDSDGEDLVKFLPPQFHPEVFTLAHHGSEHGYTEAASRVLSSPIGIISAGEGNSYGHPHAPVLERLKLKNTTILRTDLHGTIELIITKRGKIEIKTEKDR